eukprot:jgi/Chrzof1/14879/Cz09g19100.t1
MCRLVQVRQVCTPAVSFNPSARQCRLRVACVATTEDSTAQAAQLTKKAKVAFNLPHHVEFGQELCLVGEVEDLGNWSAESCLPLAWHDGDVWTAECELPAGNHIEYKYLIREPDGHVVEWQPCDNLVLELPDDVTDTVVVQDAWEGSLHEIRVGDAAAVNGSNCVMNAEASVVVTAPVAEAVIPVVPIVTDIVPDVAAAASQLAAGKANGNRMKKSTAVKTMSDKAEEELAAAIDEVSPARAEAMGTSQLKAELEKRGLPSDGQYYELMNRLKRSMQG